MRLGAYRFRPQWWGAALAALGCAVCIALGQWQAGRATERRAAMERIETAARSPAIELPAGAFDPAKFLQRRVAASGEWVPRYTVLLENRLSRGRPGYHVVQPLRLSGSDVHVIVLRGWIAAGARRTEVPQVPTPAGAQRIEGLAIDHLPQYLEAGPAQPCAPGATPCVWQNLTRERFAAWAGIRLAPILLEQASETPDGLDRNWERAEAGYLKNEMYALQWYSLAALSVILFLVLSVRRAAPADDR